MKAFNFGLRIPSQWIGLVLILCGLLIPSVGLAGGTWSSVSQYSPDQVWLMLLLSDGRILCENNPTGSTGEFDNNNKQWFLLTPDNHGSYQNGNWSYATGANESRLFFSSQVLTNGNVFVAGGEYGSGAAKAELFNPLANGGSGSWTYINPPTSLINPSLPSPALLQGNQGFVDSISEILPNGNVLVAPVGPNTYGGTLIYSPATNSWVAGPKLFRAGYQDEASWVKLPDNSILTIDPSTTNLTSTNSERYIPSSNQWVQDANVPVTMYDSSEELGPAFLLPNKKAFFLGGTGHTALYTQSPQGGTNLGSWVQGPDIPNGLTAGDCSACMMNNGKILCCVDPGFFAGPIRFYEFDYANQSQSPYGSFTLVDSPPNSDDFNGNETMMLALPTGAVIYTQVQQGTLSADNNDTLYIYTPDGVPLAAGKPVIKSITMNPDGSYHLVGTGLNGISEGAAFGDDAQMNSNYPLIRFVDGNGNVYYGRTYNWSSTGVQTGSNLESTEFTLPTNEPGGGSYSVILTANGNASDPVTLDGPVWVDFNYSPNSPQMGTYSQPFSTLAQGVSAVVSGGTISIKPGTSAETLKIAKPMTLTAVGGSATIGQ